MLRKGTPPRTAATTDAAASPWLLLLLLLPRDTYNPEASKFCSNQPTVQ
jgi:hypothetical protein